MILVAGPPCGGKTTWVRNNAAEGTSILDYDDLIESITGQRYCQDEGAKQEAYAEWHRRLPRSDFVIWTAPKRRQRGMIRTRHGASVVVVAASQEECLRRAANERPPIWKALINDWFAKWEPSRSGEWIINTGTK